MAEVDPDLVEWDYGRFEGRLTRHILKERPGWEMFRDGCPGGESPQDAAARADRFIARAHKVGGDVLAFSSGHIIRIDRGPLERPDTRRRTAVLLRPSERGRARLRTQQPRSTDHLALEPRR